VVLRLGDEVVDDADVEAELAGVLGLELADLKLDDDIASVHPWRRPHLARARPDGGGCAGLWDGGVQPLSCTAY
jgi:hypothetical protein